MTLGAQKLLRSLQTHDRRYLASDHPERVKLGRQYGELVKAGLAHGLWCFSGHMVLTAAGRAVS